MGVRHPGLGAGRFRQKEDRENHRNGAACSGLEVVFQRLFLRIEIGGSATRKEGDEQEVEMVL